MECACACLCACACARACVWPSLAAPPCVATPMSKIRYCPFDTFTDGTKDGPLQIRKRMPILNTRTNTNQDTYTNTITNTNCERTYECTYGCACKHESEYERTYEYEYKNELKYMTGVPGGDPLPTVCCKNLPECCSHIGKTAWQRPR